MEASQGIPAIAGFSWLARAPMYGAQPRWSCDHSQRADTVDLISARVDVILTSPYAPCVVHMRDTQYLLAETGRIEWSAGKRNPKVRGKRPFHNTGSHRRLRYRRTS